MRPSDTAASTACETKGFVSACGTACEINWLEGGGVHICVSARSDLLLSRCEASAIRALAGEEVALSSVAGEATSADDILRRNLTTVPLSDEAAAGGIPNQLFSSDAFRCGVMPIGTPTLSLPRPRESALRDVDDSSA